MTPDDTKAKSARGRPRDEEKNTSIIIAASQLFLELGFSGTSMDEVARKAGVSKQTVYSHFSSKEQLFSAAIHAAVERYFPETVLGSLDQHSLEGDLRVVCESYARLLLSPEALALHRVMVTESSKDNRISELFMASGPDEMEEKLLELLNGWVKSGELDIDDTAKASAMLITLIKGRPHFLFSIGLIDDVTEDMIQENVDTAVSVFLTMYRK